MIEAKDAKTASLRTLASAEDSSELRRHYLQNLVHELSTPLTPLLGYLKLFAKGSLGELSEVQRRCVDRMQHAATRLHRVLDDLSYLLHMESGMYRFAPEPVNVSELIQRVVEETTASAQEEQIELLLDVDADVEVAGDESRLALAFDHIVWNGLKFNTPGGKLLIRARALREPEPGWVRIEVFDTGIGVYPEEIERVFEPFYQSDHTSTRRFEGAGLGLTLARWIVNLHGGRIRLESPPSEQPAGHFFRGVRAIVELPLAA